MFPGGSVQVGPFSLMPAQVMTQQATRHARRVYVGGLPPSANEQTIATFFSQVMTAIGGNSAGPVVNVYINYEKKFAFVEMRSVEEASNAMALDGISFEGVSVRVKRPTDYNPALAAVLGPSLPSPHLNLAAVGLVPGAVAGAEGPDRIFVGGIPYYFSEEQMRELLESFGPLKGFDLVKDRDTGNSKGYGLCVYQVTSTVVMKGSIYEVQMHVENTSKKPNPKDLLHRNHFCPRIADGDNNGALLQLMPEGTPNKQQAGILHRICGHFSHGSDGLRVAEIEGSDVGVAFFLHFSVRKSKTELKEGEDTSILPVYYSDNYFSLVPGEIMSVSMTFEVPPGEVPLIKLNGWNYNVGLTVK